MSGIFCVLQNNTLRSCRTFQVDLGGEGVRSNFDMAIIYIEPSLEQHAQMILTFQAHTLQEKLDVTMKQTA